jgi:uncharacterized protein YjiS (DUF1127 family)
MTAHVSKEALGLMLPGTMHHYFTDEPEFIREPAPGVGLLARIGGWVSEFFARQVTGEELSHLTDAQLADIGLTRAETFRTHDPQFATDYNRSRGAHDLETGRVYAY